MLSPINLSNAKKKAERVLLFRYFWRFDDVVYETPKSVLPLLQSEFMDRWLVSALVRCGSRLIPIYYRLMKLNTPHCWLLFGAVFVAATFDLCSQSAASPRPNIIVFLVDDYDKPETSPYGGDMLTPNLDRLAREGMLFHNAHVTSTVCTPSRYTFLTGRYAGSSYSHLYSEECPEGRQGLPDSGGGFRRYD